MRNDSFQIRTKVSATQWTFHQILHRTSLVVQSTDLLLVS